MNKPTRIVPPSDDGDQVKRSSLFERASGLFGLDKLNNIERTVENLEQALAKILD